MIRWQGVMCPIDTPSRLSPIGARGHRVRVSCYAASKMCQMAVGKPIWTHHLGHENLQEIGTIEECYIRDNKLVVCGSSLDVHPETAKLSTLPDFGMSFEIVAVIPDMRARIWTISDFEEFKGCAVQAGVSFESSFQWIEE